MTDSTWPTLSLQAMLEQSLDQTHILTVNNRTARELVPYFRPEKAKVKSLPTIAPWSTWLKQRLFEVGLNADDQDSNEVSTVIDAFSSQVLWAHVIQEVEDNRPLLDVYRAAQQAASAQSLMLGWHINVPAPDQTPEFKQFKLWRDRYIDRLHAVQAIDMAELPQLVKNLIQAGAVDLPQTIILLGFTEWSPADSAVLQALSQHGVQIKQLILPTYDEPAVTAVSCLDTSDEWQQAAQWAHQQLSLHPNKRFAIVAPNLQTDAPHAKRVLTRMLQDVQSAQHYAFNVAVAPALADWSAMRAALGWLGWFMQASRGVDAPVDQVGSTLLLGFCAGQETEVATRALIDRQWRQNEIMTVTTNSWNQALSQLPKLDKAWQAAMVVTQTLMSDLKRPKQSALAWTNLWRKQLAALGFPGDAPLDSVSYQVVQAIDTQFEKFTALDQVLEPMLASEALGLMGRMARQSPFQPQRDPSARLDVLGLLEAEGGRWDAIWVMGLNDDVLPATPNPNPFIPLQVLMAAHAPRATPERERLWAEQIFKTLLQCAPHIVLSWPEQSGERQLRPSPFLSKTLSSQLNQTSIKNNDGLGIRGFEQTEMQVWADDDVPPVTLEENIKGGADVFEKQATNPLWAFFTYRLGVRALNPYALARPFSEQGKFVHEVMRELVAMYPTQSSLQAASQQVNWPDGVCKMIAEKAEQKFKGMPSDLQAMHVQRAFHVVQTWCTLDATRKPYVNVVAEDSFPFSRGPLTLSLQIDRVDQLDDGSYAVIDYKTGHIPTDLQKDWSRHEPISNQLLTYSIAWQQRNPTVSFIHALALVQLKPHQVKAVGLSVDDIGLPGVKTYLVENWPWVANTMSSEGVYVEPSVDQTAVEQAGVNQAMIDQNSADIAANQNWQVAVGALQNKMFNLVDAFIAGDARNESASINDLMFCDIRALLRLHEVDQNSSDDLTAEVGGENE
jgi:probable DNA repair protein